MNKNLQALQQIAKELESQLTLMEDREKGDFKTIMDSHVTITEYGFMKDKQSDKEYACIIIKEDPDNFYFGGKVLTEKLEAYDENGLHDAIVAEGLPVMFGTKKPTGGNAYTTVKFFPEKK